jgi:anti-sigma regulatory factor (Ser/Thr protein kinase)
MTGPAAHVPTRPAAHSGPSPRPARIRPGPRAQDRTMLLGPVITAPRCARAAVIETLSAWGIPHLTDDSTQITSELVANAVTASTQGASEDTEPAPITLTISRTHGELCIRVWDPDPTPPPRAQQASDTWTERGRGLLIVAELSSRWGWYPVHTGKYVWSALPRAAPCGSLPGEPRSCSR